MTMAETILIFVKDSYYLVKDFQFCRCWKVDKYVSSCLTSFTLPVANGSVEQISSRLNLIKSDRRCSLGEDNLENLVRICVDELPLLQWDASSASRCWWRDKLRRQSRKTEMCEVNGSTLAKPSSESSEHVFDLEDWDKYFAQC